MPSDGQIMATEQWWDLLVDRSYLGSNDLLTDEPPLPNWPFEEYVHIPDQPDLQPRKEDAMTAASASDCKDDGTSSCSGPRILSSEFDRRAPTAAKDVERDTIVLEDDDAPTTIETIAPCVIVVEDDEPTVEKIKAGSHDTMLPPDKPCAKKASESDGQPDKPRVTLPIRPDSTIATRPKKQRRPQSINTNSTTPKIDAQSTTIPIITAVKKKQPAKKMSIPGLGEFALAVKVEPGQEPEIKIEGKEEGEQASEPQIPPTPKRTLLLTNKALKWIKAATEAYDVLYNFEARAQQKILVCYIHAHPTSLHKPESQCITEALNLRQEILLSKERNLRLANPTLPFKPASSFPDSRLNFQNTMGMIIAMQNKPKLNATAQEKKVYDVCLMHEMLKWEVEMMREVTKWCDEQREERLKETGIKFRIRDGMFIDLESMISFPVNGN